MLAQIQTAKSTEGEMLNAERRNLPEFGRVPKRPKEFTSGIAKWVTTQASLNLTAHQKKCDLEWQVHARVALLAYLEDFFRTREEPTSMDEFLGFVWMLQHECCNGDWECMMATAEVLWAEFEEASSA